MIACREPGADRARSTMARTIRNVLPDRLPPRSRIWVERLPSTALASRCFGVRLKPSDTALDRLSAPYVELIGRVLLWRRDVPCRLERWQAAQVLHSYRPTLDHAPIGVNHVWPAPRAVRLERERFYVLIASVATGCCGPICSFPVRIVVSAHRQAVYTLHAAALR